MNKTTALILYATSPESLFIIPFLEYNLVKMKKKKNRAEIIFVVASITLYCIAASLVSLHRYWQYNAFWYDFGIFDETVWKLSQFKLPVITQLNPPQGKIVWADHFNPSSIFLAPFYWISNKQEIILVAQTIFVGLSAFIGFLITKKEIKSKIVRLSLLVSYLGFVGLQNALFTDVHNIVFALLPLMLSIWAIYQRRWQLYFLFLFITLGWQESMAAVGAGLGLFLILRKDKNIKVGLLTLATSLFYGILTMKVIIPVFRGNPYTYQPDIPTVWYEWIMRFFIPPEMKLKAILATFATFGFLPLFNISTVPMIVEHYLERFVLNMAATRWDLGFHYNVLLSPIMFLASLEVIRRLQNNKRVKKLLLLLWGIITITIVVFLHRFYLHGPLMLATHPAFYQTTKQMKFLDDFVKKIPKDKFLMTQNNLATHFTHGKTVLLNLDYQEIKPDVVAVDIREGQNANNFFPLQPHEVKNLVASLSADLNYTKKEITDSQLIFMMKN